MLDTALDNGGPVPVDRHPDRHQVKRNPAYPIHHRPTRPAQVVAADAGSPTVPSPPAGLVIAGGTTILYQRSSDNLRSGGKLSRIHWRSWYCVARLLRWAGCRNLARAAAQRGHQLVEAVSVRAASGRHSNPDVTGN